MLSTRLVGIVSFGDVEEVEKELEHSSLQDKMDKELQELYKARIRAIQNVEGFTGKGSSPDRTLTSSITVASSPQFWGGVMKSSLQHLSVCKTSIPELSQSMEKAIDGLRSRYVYKVKVKPLVGHIVVCRDTKQALDGDDKMGNMVAHDVQDITKEDGEIIEAVEHLKAQEGSVNVVNADLPTSEGDTDTGLRIGATPFISVIRDILRGLQLTNLVILDVQQKCISIGLQENKAPLNGLKMS
ncbi:hypothetical protein GIB67_037843 [Kingdonia uniflora]|uniref:Uncharacterized protein n=1 Tax=Kingdonia uniflora TaxID=39325 RepID=A0A7J7LGV6_9MAGN|nr:hypothetical protein GIB67_037843 [Kingdonia uniflora]